MRTRLYLLLLSAIPIGCGTDGEGTVTVTAYGESFIEEGIPAFEIDDGWGVTFNRFEVSVLDVKVAGTQIPVLRTIDLTGSSSGSGHDLGSARVPDGNHTNSSFIIDRVEVDGAATRGKTVKTFSWIFDQATAYSHCATTTKVTDGGAATFQITIHADHLLYDSLVAAEPKLLFQSLADADADSDGEISKAELAAAGIGAYDPGSEGGIDDLWSWLNAQTRTLGHVDGEGHCQGAASST